MKHKLSRFNVLVILLGIISFGVVAVMSPPSSTNQPYVFQKPLEVIYVFYEAVGRKEFKVFNIVLSKDNLVPTHVEYLYNLSTSIPTIKVHCNLKKPVALPEQEGLYVSSATAIMENGSIVDSVAHVSFDETKFKE